MTDHTSAEQKSREMLERIGVDDASSFSAGDLVELANLIDALEQARGAMQADDDRLYEAGERVGLFHGCDTADAMAQEIERLRTELVRYASLEHENKRALDKYNSDLRVENAALRESNERLRKELANEQARGIHSCHPNCTRDGCVNRRLRGMLSEALDQFEDYGDHGFWRVPASLMGRIREELGEG